MKGKIFTEFKAALTPPNESSATRFKWAPLYSGGECDIDGFTCPAVADLETLVIDNNPPALVEHDPDQICGRLENVRIVKDDTGRLSVICDAVVGGTQYADDVIQYYKNGPVNLKPSIGIRRIRNYNVEYLHEGEEASVNGRTFRGPIAIVRHGHLVEGSFVSLAGDPEAVSFLAALNKTKGKTMTFEEFLQSKDLTQEAFDALSDDEKKALETEFNQGNTNAEAELGDGGTDAAAAPASGESVKEAVAEAVAEQIGEMTADQAAEAYLQICSETEDELAAEMEEEANDEDFKARAKSIASKKMKERIFRAKIKERKHVSGLDESRRISAIKAFCASYGRDGAQIAGKAIAEGWSFNQTERVMNASIAKGKRMNSLMNNVSGVGNGNRPSKQDILTAAFAMQCRLKPEYVQKHFGYTEQVMNAAMGKEYNRLGFKRLVHESVNSFKPGYANIDSSMMDLLPTMRGFCRNRKQAELTNPNFNASMGFSTISATDILKAVIEAYLLDQEDAAPTFYRQITKEVSFSDFNTVDSYLPTLVGALSKISETGQIENVTYTTEKFQAKTEPLGAIFSIPEMVLINDQLSAFVSLLEQFRELPEKCVEHDTAKLFWRMVDGDVLYKDGSAFFSTARGNVFTGADSALKESGLAMAQNALDSMKDGNGAPLSAEGAFIVTNSMLFPTARRLYVSENINVQDTVGTRNVFQGIYTPYKWQYLNKNLARAKKDDSSTDSSFVTYETSQWFMFRDPQRRPIITVNKLRGYESPQIKQFDADPSVWGTVYQLIYPYAVSPMWTDGAVVMRGA